jgi:NAD(P)-dependent dehydrogenase (short-subunit alcohol dehydrogenase family)
LPSKFNLGRHVRAHNVRGVFIAIQASFPHLGEGGRIITIGSNTAIRTAIPGGSVYSMTKGAVASLVRASLSTSRRAGLRSIMSSPDPPKQT